MNKVKALIAMWNRLLLMLFWPNRERLYADLANSMERRELLRSFIEGELAIATGRGTADSARACALRQMAAVPAGEKLSRVIGQVMPAGDRMMLAAIDDVLEKDRPPLLRQLRKAVLIQKRARKLVMKKAVSILVILPALFMMAYVISSEVIPTVEASVPASAWTPFNRMVRVLANAIKDHGMQGLTVAVLALIGLMLALPRWSGPWRRRLESVPVWLAVGLLPVAPWLLPLIVYRDYQGMMMLSALAVVVESGKTVPVALEMVGRAGSPYVRGHIRLILHKLKHQPDNVRAAFANGMFSAPISARLASLARTLPDFGQVLQAAGLSDDDEVVERIERSAETMKNAALFAAMALVAILYYGQLSIVGSIDDGRGQVNLHK